MTDFPVTEQDIVDAQRDVRWSGEPIRYYCDNVYVDIGFPPEDPKKLLDELRERCLSANPGPPQSKP